MKQLKSKNAPYVIKKNQQIESVFMLKKKVKIDQLLDVKNAQNQILENTTKIILKKLKKGVEKITNNPDLL